MSEVPYIPAGARRSGCPSCGSGLHFDIGKQAMVCAQCGSEFDVKNLPQEDLGDETIEATAYRCPQCGAEIYTDSDTQAAGHCMFCGSDVVLAGRLCRIRRPERVVPFRITREKCAEIYRKHLSSYHLAPASLKKQEVTDLFQPVYVPFWTYRISAEGPAEGFVGYSVHQEGANDVHIKYGISAEVSVKDESPAAYDASEGFEDETGYRLMFNTKDAVPYHTGYLSGFYAQAADVEPEKFQEDAAAFVSARLMDRLRRACSDKVGGVDLNGRVRHYGLPNLETEPRLVMMPVWLLTRRTGRRVLYSAINGVNGNIVCDPPVSHGILAGLTAVITVALFFLLQTFLNVKPDLMAGISAILAVMFHIYIDGRQEILDREKHPELIRGEGERYLAFIKRKIRVEGSKFGDEHDIPSDKRADMAKAIAVVVLPVSVVLNFYYLFKTGKGMGCTILLPAGCLISMIMLLYGGFRFNIITFIRFLMTGAMGYMTYLVITGQFEDTLYYGCAFAFLLLSVLPVVLLNLHHNTYVTRPVPYFGGKEKEAET